MFEFNVPYFYLADQCLLSLYTTGLITGTVLDIGDSVTCAASVIETRKQSYTTLNLGGNDLTNWLFKHHNFSVRNQTFTTKHETDFTRDLKEDLCYVAFDFDSEMEKPPPAEKPIYTFPNGQKTRIGLFKELFQCPELLFKSNLSGINYKYGGIHQMLFQTINECNRDIQEELYSHIVLSGGSSMFKGLPERLEKEMKYLAPEMNVNIIAVDDRINVAFVGGSIVASLSCFPEMTVNREEYQENGPSFVNLKCN